MSSICYILPPWKRDFSWLWVWEDISQPFVKFNGHVQTGRLSQAANSSDIWLSETNDQMLTTLYRKAKIHSEVYMTYLGTRVSPFRGRDDSWVVQTFVGYSDYFTGVWTSFCASPSWIKPPIKAVSEMTSSKTGATFMAHIAKAEECWRHILFWVPS